MRHQPGRGDQRKVWTSWRRASLAPGQFMVIDCAGCAGVGERLEGSKSKFESGEMSESEMGAVRRVRL